MHTNKLQGFHLQHFLTKACNQITKLQNAIIKQGQKQNQFREMQKQKKRKRMNLEKWGWQRIDQTRQAQAYYQPRPMIHWNTEKTLFF